MRVNLEKAVVLGGGAGAFCWTGLLAKLGINVYLGCRTLAALDAISSTGSLVLNDGDSSETFRVAGTGTPAELVSQAHLIVLCVPADRLLTYFDLIAEHLTGDHVVLLAPGNTGGALAIGSRYNYRPPFRLAELNTLPFIARKEDARTVRQFIRLAAVHWSALPNSGDPELTSVMKLILPEGINVQNVFQTALTNFNPVIHPPAMLVNAARLEKGDDFYWYVDGSTPSAGRIMDAIDAERMMVQEALGLPKVSFADFFALAKYSPETELTPEIAGILRNSRPNKGIKAPKTIEHRFFHEDVPFGLIPLREMGRYVNRDLRVTDSVIKLCEVIMGKDYYSLGFSAEKMGLGKMAPGELLSLIK